MTSTVMTKRIVSKDRVLEMAPILAEIIVHAIITREAMIMEEPVAIQVVVPNTTPKTGTTLLQTVSGLLTLFFVPLHS